MNSALATAVFIVNIEGTVHMGNIFKDMLDSFSSPSEPVKAEPKSKGLGAKSSMFIEDPGREAEKAEKSKTATGAATATVAKMYTDIVREQNKDDTGNTPIVSTTSVAYSSASDDARDISNQGYYPDKIIRDSMLSGKLSSATPRRNVTTEALDDIEAMIEKNRSKAVRNNRVYKAPIPSVETTYLDDYVDETERAITTEDADPLSFYERYIAPTKTGLGVDPSRLANPPTILNDANEIKGAQTLLTNLGYKPNGIDGEIGGGTRRAVRKFQKQHGLTITGRLTQNTVDLLNDKSVMSYPDAPKPKAKVIQFTNPQLDLFGDEVAKIESSNRYDAIGGYLNHYDGKYQLGASAKSDAGRIMGVSLDHDTASRAAFRANPALQEKAFAAYTLSNHTHLTKNSSIYRSMSPEEKLGILGYAHNQGATAAEEYLFTGVVGKDAFGTKGTKYVKAMQNALASLSGNP